MEKPFKCKHSVSLIDDNVADLHKAGEKANIQYKCQENGIKMSKHLRSLCNFNNWTF